MQDTDLFIDDQLQNIRIGYDAISPKQSSVENDGSDGSFSFAEKKGTSLLNVKC